MKLVIGTAHRACSLALIEGTELIAQRHEMIGRGHAEMLIPMVAELLDGQKPDGIIVERGPGSFTGIRVGIAAARALALAWSIEARGVTSLELLAAQAAHAGAEDVTVVLDGARREVFAQRFSGLRALSGVSVIPAADVIVESAHVIGTGVPLIDIGAAVSLGDDAPDASAARLIPEAQLSTDISPLYVRAPDAKPAAA